MGRHHDNAEHHLVDSKVDFTVLTRRHICSSSLIRYVSTRIDPTVDRGCGRWPQYTASVTRLMQISVDLIMNGDGESTNMNQSL